MFSLPSLLQNHFFEPFSFSPGTGKQHFYGVLEIISLSPFMMSTASSVAEYQPTLSINNCDFFSVCYKNLATFLPCKYLYSPNS